jgi:DNA polymerase-1
MTNEHLDREGVINKFGIPPERIVDYLSITGDVVDNVPGVAKAGPKTAVKWLTEFGDLDNLVKNADQVKGVVGQNLRDTLEWLPQAKKLITVKTDCDLEGHMLHLDELLAKHEDHDELKNLFVKYGFRTWLKEYGLNGDAAGDAAPAYSGKSFKSESKSSKPASSAAPTTYIPGLADVVPAIEHIDRRYECVTEQAQLNEWIERISKAQLTCIDTETTSLEPMNAQMVGISLCTESGRACYIPLAHSTMEAQLQREQVLEQLRPWLEDPQAKKVGQNLKYDLHIFANHGIQLQGVEHDTLLESYVIESHRSHDMDSLAQRHLGEKTIKFEEVCGKGVSQITFDQVDLPRATEYAAEDADITLRLHKNFMPQLAADSKLNHVYQDIEMPAMRVLFIMERNGILVDAQKLAAQGQQVGRRMLELEQEIFVLAKQPFNIQSPKQIGEILFGQLQLPVIKKTPSGAPSTDEEVLLKLSEDYPLPARILDYRSLAKLQSTYIEKLPRMINAKTGRVHTNFSQAVAVTGRLASSEPNLQNIPVRTEEGRKIREAFVAKPGCKLISADYSQIELRIMAHIAQDQNLLDAFAAGKDIHQATAAEMFGVELDQVTSEQRRYAKVINFGLIYGMSAFGLAGNLGIERAAAQKYIDTYFGRYPGVAQYMANTRVLAKEQGYVETVFGRRLWLPEIQSSNGMRRQAAERAAINAPMQGTAADLIKMAMIAVQSWLETSGSKAKLLLQVHDELILEVPENEVDSVKEHLRNLMTQVAKLDVPLEVGIGVGDNWEVAH